MLKIIRFRQLGVVTGVAMATDNMSIDRHSKFGMILAWLRHEVSIIYYRFVSMTEYVCLCVRGRQERNAISRMCARWASAKNGFENRNTHS